MRAFRDEYMVGSSAPGKRTFSAITAALFADSGWYDVNETMIEPLAWGHDAGCDFLTRPCSEWTEPRYLCTQKGDSQCSYDRRGMAYCDLTVYAHALPAAQRYFDDAHRGGYSELLDYCPVYRSYANGDCTDGSRLASTWLPQGGQERCEQCRCFEATTNSFAPRPSCFRMRCLNHSRLEMRVGERWRACPAEGGDIYLAPLADDVTGRIACPPAAELCGFHSTLWPSLHAIEPVGGPTAGGTPITLHGEHLDELRPPLTLSFGTAEGAENIALALHVLNATVALATVPRLVGATSRARADVTLTDVSGRTAVLWRTFEYDPGWQPYAVTLGLFGTLVVLGCWLVPAFVRAGCERSQLLPSDDGDSYHRAPWRERLVWKTLDREMERRLYAKAKVRPASESTAGAHAALSGDELVGSRDWWRSFGHAVLSGFRRPTAQAELV